MPKRQRKSNIAYKIVFLTSFLRKETKRCYLVPKVVCSSVHNPETKKMVEMSWLLAPLLSFMQSGSARMSGIAMMPPNARM